MSQPPSNSTLNPYSSSGSSARSSLGSFVFVSESPYHQGQGGGYGSSGGHMAVPESTEQFHPYINLPSNVKLPPSYKQPEYSQEYRAPAQPPQPAPRTYTAPLQPPSVTVGSVGHAHTGGVVIHPGHSIEAGVPMSEVVRQLDFAATENLRLRERLQYNNEVLDRKLQEIEVLLRQKETDSRRMEKTVEQKEKEKEEALRNASEATKNFFEARVAVMGYKSRQLQLQGEVECLRAEIARKNSGVQSSGAGPAAPVGTTQQELDTLRRENQQLQIQKQDLLGRLQNGGIKEVDHAVEELRRQLSKLKQDKESLELNMTAVVDELQKDITGLQNKRSLDQDEIQRITTSATELQQRVWTFQQQNGSLRNQLGQQQVEMQRNIESLQNELMATKQQQFYQASSEVSQLRADLQESQSKISQLTAELGINQAENISLKAEVDQVKERNKALREKVNELKQMNDTFGQKLRQHSGPVTTMPPGSPPTPAKFKTAPIPKPRTSLQPVSIFQVEQLEKQKSDLEQEKTTLEREKTTLEREKAELLEQLERVSKLRTTAESELHHSTTKAQQMIEDNIRLKKSLEDREGILSGQGEQIRRLEEDIRRLQVQLQAAPSPGQLQQHEEQIQHLGWEKSELQSRVATLERELSSKSQLVVEVESLRGQIVQTAELESEVRKERGQKVELESELSSLRREKSQREDELGSLRRKNAELEGQVTRFQELERAKKPVTGRQNPEIRLAHRLSEALGTQKELEKMNVNLEEEKKALKEENERILKELQDEKQRHDHIRRQSEQLSLSYQQIKEEKTRMEQEELLRARSASQSLLQEKQTLQEENQTLRRDLDQAVTEKMQYRTRIDQLNQELTQKSDQLQQELTQKSDCERQLKDLREQRDTFEHQLTEFQQYQGQLEADLQDKRARIQQLEEKQQTLQAQYNQKTTLIEQLQQEIARLQQQEGQLQQRIQALTDGVAQKQHSKQQLETQVQRLQKENQELDCTMREFRKECESLMADYQVSAERLRESEAERDKYKNQYETALRELAQRAERIKQLEQQRKEATERNEHMSFQLKQYTDDFDRERTAREEAVQVKNIVEQQIKKKDREISSLRQQLNVHAQHQLQEEWDDNQVGGDGGRTSPFTSPLGVGGGGGGMGRHPPGDPDLLPHKRSRPQDPQFGQQPFNPTPQPFNKPQPFMQMQPPPSQPLRAWQPEQNVAGSGTFGAQDRQFDQSEDTLPLLKSLKFNAFPQPHHTQPQPPAPVPRAQPGGMGGMEAIHRHTGVMGQRPPPPIQDHEMPIPRAQTGVMGGLRGQPDVMGGLRGQPDALGGLRGQPDMMGGIHGQRRDTLQPGHAPAPRNDLNMPITFAGGGGGGGGPADGGQGPGWVAPGDVVNEKPPSMACPICNKADFRTQTDLEVHCAQCTSSLF